MQLYWKHRSAQDEERISLLHPSLRSTLKSSARRYLGTFVFCTLILWTILSIFFGANYKKSELVHNLAIDLVDLDRGPVGREISEIIMAMPQSMASPTWRLRADIRDIDQARRYARDNAWGVLVINSGLSGRLASALTLGTDYDASLALTMLKQGAYHPMAQPLYIQSTIAATASLVSAQVTARQLAEFKATANATARASANPHALLHPISMATENLGPYDFELGTLIPPLTFLLMTLCLLVPLMMSKFGAFPLYKRAKHLQIYAALVLVITGLCAVFALFGSLVFLAFKGPHYNTQRLGLPITGGRFFQLWSTYLLTLLPTMFWLKSLSLVVPTSYAAVPSIMTVIPNMCSAIVVLELCPPFFRWFQAMPFFQGGMLTRYVISGAHARLGENLGVLFGELGFSLALLFACTRMHQHNVVAGNVDIMGNYTVSWSDIIPRLRAQSAAMPAERVLEQGEQPQHTSVLPDLIPITDEFSTHQNSMRNETVAI
ncbi:hypothetical protein LPJ63_004166 [Coemansia sp. RSA 2711]|nr:hypothetical protein LPJ63_004166 [Coemansia sp. RSA 2711]